MSKYFNVAQMAERLGRSAFTVRRMARTSKIPGRKVGRDWQFDPECVERSLNQTHGNHLVQAAAFSRR